jgi:hypothetical protein
MLWYDEESKLKECSKIQTHSHGVCENESKQSFWSWIIMVFQFFGTKFGRPNLVQIEPSLKCFRPLERS